MASGWDALAGAAGYVQQKMQRDEDIKYKAQLEEAAMKRQMFLEKYRSDIQAERQKELNEQEAKIREEQDSRKREVEKNDVIATFNTAAGTFGRTRAGETVPFYQKTEEELNMERQKDQLALDAQRANIAQSYASSEASKALAETRKLPKATLTPEDKTQAKILAESMRLANNPEFAASLEIDPEEPDYQEQVAAAAVQRVQATVNALNKDHPLNKEAGKDSSKQAPYPEGTRLKGKDGKIYVVRNGQAVLE